MGPVSRRGPVSTQSLPTGTAADTPLREEDDPFRSTRGVEVVTCEQPDSGASSFGGACEGG